MPGTYEWTWETGANQNFTPQIGPAAAVPEASSLLLVALPLGLVLLLASRHRGSIPNRRPPARCANPSAVLGALPTSNRRISVEHFLAQRLFQATARECRLMNAINKIYDYRILLSTGAAASALAPCYYIIGRPFHVGARLSDLYLFTFAFAIALLVGYQIFFSVQALTTNRKAHIVYSNLDSRIPFVVQWVWVYGLVYYALLGLPLAFFSHLGQCLKCIAGGFTILVIASAIFLMWPTRCPPEWRRFPVTGPSSRFLAFIQRMDKGQNCCPSLHCTLAAYTATFIPSVALLFLIPALICLSCVLVKQHSIIDLPGGLAFGFVIGFVANQLT
jgi:hypothetical protein